MLLLAFGLLGGIVALLSNIPYIVDTLRGKTKPHRVTWGIFLALNIIFFANHLASGATSSIWLVVSFLVSTLIVFALSFKNGVGGTTRLDFIVLGGAILGVFLWYVLDAPIASIIANVAVASLAFTPTFVKAYKDPGSETEIKWLLSAVGAGLTILSVGELNLALLILPVYSFVAQGALYVILIRKTITRRLHES